MITKRDRRELIRLLGLLQDSLECDMTSNVVPETNEAGYKRLLVQAHKDWRAAEDLVSRLQKDNAPANASKKQRGTKFGSVIASTRAADKSKLTKD